MRAARSDALVAQDGLPVDRYGPDVDYRDIVLDSVSHGFCVFDAGLTIRLSNRRMRDLFGMPESVTHVGASMYGLLKYSHEQGRLDGMSLERAWQERLALIALGKPFSRVERFDDGRIVSISYQPTTGGGWVAIHQDISAQQRLEEELRSQATIFREALENMSHALAVFDASKRLVVCNSRYLTMYGYEHGEIRPGIHLHQIFALAIERGNYTGITLDQLIAESDRNFALGSRRTSPSGSWQSRR
ncbi:MAG: diguanylate cyclase [Xanthobacteraceae bacterium]|nr:MAG: diguanylate cyclase [Xanthobacteraceae bacterium]